MIIQRRRNFLVGLGGLLVAPAIVKASSLMPISTNLVRFGLQDHLTPFNFYRYGNESQEEISARIVAAKVSPLDNTNFILLTDTGNTIETEAVNIGHIFFVKAMNGNRGRMVVQEGGNSDFKTFINTVKQYHLKLKSSPSFLVWKIQPFFPFSGYRKTAIRANVNHFFQASRNARALAINERISYDSHSSIDGLP